MKLSEKYLKNQDFAELWWVEYPFSRSFAHVLIDFNQTKWVGSSLVPPCFPRMGKPSATRYFRLSHLREKWMRRRWLTAPVAFIWLVSINLTKNVKGYKKTGVFCICLTFLYYLCGDSLNSLIDLTPQTSICTVLLLSLPTPSRGKISQQCWPTEAGIVGIAGWCWCNTWMWGRMRWVKSHYFM